jgi:hypothetical protein
MTPERWRQITGVFHDALARNPSTRGAFLDQACAGDRSVREQVDRLLAAHQDAGRFGETAVPVTPGGTSLELDRTTPSAADPRAEDSPADRDRPRALLAVLWLSAAIVFAIFTYAAWLIAIDGVSSRSFGWREARRAHRSSISGIEPGGPAVGRLQRGDRIINLNGIPPLADSGTYFQRRHLRIGDAFEITVERDGRRETHRLTTRAGPNVLGSSLTYFVVSLVWCSVGLFMAFARPERAVARVAAAAAVTTGLVFLQSVTRSGPIFQPLHAVLGFHFFLRFPTDQPARGIWKWALRASYVGAGMAIGSALLLRGTVSALGLSEAARVVEHYPTLFGVRAFVGLPAYQIALIGMAVAIPLNYRRLTDADSRRRVRWVVYGSIVGLSLQIWWTLSTVLTGGGDGGAYPFGPLAANALTVAIPLSVAYAVLKHRMFDITVVVRRGLQYLLARRGLQVATVVPVVAFFYTVAVNRHLTIGELAIETRGYLYWLTAAGLALRFRRPIQSWLDRRFFREAYDREQLLLGLFDDVGKVESISELSRVVSERLEFALHPRTAFMWYRDPGELAAASASYPLLTPAGFPSSEHWLAWLEERGAPTRVPRAMEVGLSGHDVRWFSDRGVSLIVPIRDSSERLIGALLLGEKKSEEPYTAADEKLLGAIAKQAAVVREHLRLRARISEDARVRHDVLARLDGNLADLLKECPACGSCFDGAVERCENDGQLLILSLPVPRTIEGKYRLDRMIGKGGMGAVYQARDLRLDRAVAVKVMLGRAFGQQTALRRFGREARAAARLNHPNIVGVYDVGLLAHEGAYLVMELVAGVTLRAELNRHGAMQPSVAADWFDPLLAGITAAHGAGLIHRDLKPENVIGRRSDSGALDVKILDLGLVKFGAEEPLPTDTITAEGVVMGTLGYMSPEQLLGREVDHRTDLFAVAVMLFEALTGHRPFHDASHAKLASAVQQTFQRPGLSDDARALGDLLKQCLAADPRERPSAASLRSALIPVLCRCPPLSSGASL